MQRGGDIGWRRGSAVPMLPPCDHKRRLGLGAARRRGSRCRAAGRGRAGPCGAARGGAPRSRPPPGAGPAAPRRTAPGPQRSRRGGGGGPCAATSGGPRRARHRGAAPAPAPAPPGRPAAPAPPRSGGRRRGRVRSAVLARLRLALLALCVLLMKSMDVISIKDNYIFKLNIKFCTKTKLHEISVCSRAARQRVRRGGRKCCYAMRADPFHAYLRPVRCFPVRQVKLSLFPHATVPADASHAVVLGRPCSHPGMAITAWCNADKN